MLQTIICVYAIIMHLRRCVSDFTSSRATNTECTLQRVFCSQRIPFRYHLGHKSKCKFLHTAVSSPQDRSKRFTLYIPDRPVHSDTISASLGSIQPYATINARSFSYTHPPLFIVRYSFIQLSELEQCRVKQSAIDLLCDKAILI